MTSKREKKSTSREKLGFGIKYTLAVVISILAICALYFIYVSVATHFSPPLQPMFDQERLGQLGDFLGGTLNPIFGFVTVGLLLWSIFTQRKELSLTREELGLTREELRSSAKAQQTQVDITRQEYERKQLDDAVNYSLLEVQTLFNLKIFTSLEKLIHSGKVNINDPNVSLNDRLQNRNISIIDKKSENNIHIIQLKKILPILKNNIIELTVKKDYITIESLKDYWRHRFIKIIEDCYQLEIISRNERNTLTSGMNVISETPNLDEKYDQ